METHAIIIKESKKKKNRMTMMCWMLLDEMREKIIKKEMEKKNLVEKEINSSTFGEIPREI